MKQGDRLPPAVPLVFYNGDAKWWAPLDVSELIEPVPASFAGYLPSLRYCLIDEKRWPLEDLEDQRGNVVAGIARVEQDHGPDYLVRMVGELHRWLERPEQGSLRRDLLAWLSKTVLPARAPGLDVPELHNLYEFKTYLETTMQTWPEQWEAKGRQEGIRVGREEGIRMGRQEGLQEGRQEGRQEGQKEGEAAVLLRLLGRKFGPPDEGVRARIRSADADLLLGWAERVLSAETLDDVFSDADG